MIEYHAQENSYIDLRGCDRDVLNDLLEIGIQVKEKLGLMASPIQYDSGSRVYIGSIIGNLSLNNTRLIIGPKVPNDVGDPVAVVKSLYERTLKCSMGSLGSTIYFAKNSIVTSDELFIDVLATLFISSLSSALRGSKIMQYEEKTERRSVIKGRVLMGKQLSQPVLDEKTWCKYNFMSDNNVYNQLLYWACKYLSASVHNFELKRKLLMLSKEFTSKTDLLTTYAVKGMRLSRQFAEYIDTLAIARNLYLESGGQKESGKAGNQICGYVINMERAFENIVCYYTNAVALKLGLSHKDQASIRFATANGNYDYDYDIRPDDLVSGDGKYLVMDAKYKVLSADNRYKRKPSRDDFYQMVSSCIAYKSPEAILVYPLTAKFPNQTWSTIQTVNGEKISIKSIGIDILGSNDDISNTIKAALQDSYLYKEKNI